MNIRSFAGSLTLLSLLAVSMPQPALHSQSQSKALTSPAKPADDSPIRFAYQPIDFKLDSDETPERHAPETMAGGVAVFDYNNDGKLDIFFTNGADIHTLHKDSPKYRNRLFENDGKGHFTDVTDKAGLAGSGYDAGLAIGDYDNDGYEDIFVAGVYRNTLYQKVAGFSLWGHGSRPVAENSQDSFSSSSRLPIPCATETLWRAQIAGLHPSHIEHQFFQHNSRINHAKL